MPCCLMPRLRSTWRGRRATCTARSTLHGARWRAVPLSIDLSGSVSSLRSELPDHSHDDTLDEHFAFLEAERPHRRVGRLQADPATGLAVEALDRCLTAIDERDHHLAVVRRFA